MKLTAAERKVFKRMGRKGGKARAAALSPARRVEIARMGAKAKAEKDRARASLEPSEADPGPP